MEAYFVIVKEKATYKYVETMDFCEQSDAKAFADKKESEGFYVSIWKAFRIYTSGD